MLISDSSAGERAFFSAVGVVVVVAADSAVDVVVVVVVVAVVVAVVAVAVIVGVVPCSRSSYPSYFSLTRSSRNVSLCAPSIASLLSNLSCAIFSSRIAAVSVCKAFEGGITALYDMCSTNVARVQP